jgi:hypothetical protein
MLSPKSYKLHFVYLTYINTHGTFETWWLDSRKLCGYLSLTVLKTKLSGSHVPGHSVVVGRTVKPFKTNIPPWDRGVPCSMRPRPVGLILRSQFVLYQVWFSTRVWPEVKPNDSCALNGTFRITSEKMQSDLLCQRWFQSLTPIAKTQFVS